MPAPGAPVPLGGPWRAAEGDEALRRRAAAPDFDDSGWLQVAGAGAPLVRGGAAATGAGAGTARTLVYRRRFSLGPLPPSRRAWLVADGANWDAELWLDGSYLGDVGGPGPPRSFDVTRVLSGGGDHVLAMEAPEAAPPATDRGGASPHLVSTGPVKLLSVRAACRDANSRRAVLSLWAVVDSSVGLNADLVTTLAPVATGTEAVISERRHPLAPGVNRLRWSVEVADPELWWPAGLGAQPMYSVSLRLACDGEPSDSVALETGLRQVRVRDMRWSVNGVPVFVRALDLGAEADSRDLPAPEELLGSGLNALRLVGAGAGPAFYEAADRHGLMVWQEPHVPARRLGRAHAVRRAGELAALLGHHPSIVAWGAGAGPRKLGRSGLSWAHGRAASSAAALSGAGRPGWLVARAVRRALTRSDGSRPVLSPPRVVTAVGVASVGRAAAWWPASARFPLLAASPGQDDELQASVEDLRRLRLRACSGFLVVGAGALVVPAAGPAPAGPSADGPVMGGEGERQVSPALRRACAPVLVTARWPVRALTGVAATSLALHVVNDTPARFPAAVLRATVTWPGGGRRVELRGDVEPLSTAYVGHLELPPGRRAVTGRAPVPVVHVDLVLDAADGRTVSTNSYSRALRGAVPVTNW